MNNIASIDGIGVEQGSDNPYTDLSYANADEMQVKAGLAHEIAQIIKNRRFTQQKAAALLNMQQSKLSDMLLGKFRDISQAKMIDCLKCLVGEIEIVV